MRIRGVVLLCAAACGSVADKMPDARVDSPVMQGDVAIDSPQNIPRTAIGVDGISTFAAVPTTMTKIPYSAEVYDDANEFDTSTNRFTAAGS